MTHYDRGRRFEWRIRDDLRKNGYTVLRTAGSKGDSKIDLLAFKPGQALFVQAKSGAAPLPLAEWDRLVEVAGWVGAIPLLATSGPNGRGIEYVRLLGRKVPRSRTQPVEPFLLDLVTA